MKMMTTEWQRLAGLALVAAGAMLSGCPGAESDLPEAGRSAIDLVSGTLAAGPSYQLEVQGVRAIGGSGFARETGPACGLNAPFQCGPADRYEIRIQSLEAPYLLRASASAASLGVTDTLYGAALGAGTAHLTALTTLQLYQLAGMDPGAAFPFGQSTPFVLDAPALDAAQREVTLYLRQAFDIDIASGAAPFGTAAFEPRAGDPMYDALVTIDALQQAQGLSLAALGERIALRARRCRQEQVALTGAAPRLAFCPAARAAVADPAEPGVTVHTFTSDLGETLVLRARDAELLSLRFDDGRGGNAGCDAPACAGASLGPLQDDTTRRLGLSAVPLEGAGGLLQLDGELRSAPEDLDLPALACSDNRYDLALADASVVSLCSEFSPSGVGGVRMLQSRGTREVYTLRDAAVSGPASVLEVVIDGDALVSVIALHVDEVTGLLVADWLCRRADCQGVSVGPALEDSRFGARVVTRRIRFGGTVLQRVRPDGTLDPGDSARLHASLLAQRDTAVSTLQNLPCGADSDAVSVQIAGTAATTSICPPADPQGNTLLGRFDTADGGVGYFIASLAASPDGSETASSDSLTVTVDAAGTVQRVDAQLLRGSTPFACIGAAACAAVSVLAPDAEGRVRIVIDGLTLVEQDSGGLPGERSAGASGGFTVPPP